MEEVKINDDFGMPEFRKDFKDLEFTDDFMFCAALINNPDICRELAEMVVGRKITKIVHLQDQKAIRILPDGKGVRFDVALEGEDEICDIEMQNVIDLEVLAKRSRYYQSASDIDFLVKGKDYTKLKKSYIIFMTTKKLFADSDLHMFRFRNFCAEDKSIELGDETEKIFLTTAGTADDITPEMEALMAYMTEKETKTDFTKRLDEAIEKIKAGEGWRLEYFQLKEKLDNSYNAGKRSGKIEGRKEGREEGVDKTLAVLDMIDSGVDDPVEISKEIGMPQESVEKILESRIKK